MQTGDTKSNGSASLPLDLLHASDLASFRVRLRLALAEFSAAATAQWEKDNRIPPSAIAALGKARVFRDRWQHGGESGLPYLLVYSEEIFR